MPLRSEGRSFYYGASPRYPVVLGLLQPFGLYGFFWQCLLGGRLGPPFFPAGKESAAGGVKKGGQGGLPMGPLDDPPTANKGGVRAPFFGLIPRGAGVHSRAPEARSTI